MMKAERFSSSTNYKSRMPAHFNHIALAVLVRAVMHKKEGVQMRKEKAKWSLLAGDILYIEHLKDFIKTLLAQIIQESCRIQKFIYKISCICIH